MTEIAEWARSRRSRWQTAGDELGYEFPERYEDEQGVRVRRHEYIDGKIYEACDWCSSVMEWTSELDDNTCLFETRALVDEAWETFFMCWRCHVETSPNCTCEDCEWVEAFGSDEDGMLMVSQEGDEN